MNHDWIVTHMREADLPAVLEIERLSFRTPWPEDAFVSDLDGADWAHAMVIVDPNHPEAGARGYICFWTLEGELTIQNIATHPEERRRGGARRMMDAAFAEARRPDARGPISKLRPSNDAALHLYCKWGFTAVGRRPGYYEDTGEDALVMRAAVNRGGRAS